MLTRAQRHKLGQQLARTELAAEVGYPLVVRPSYVLGGRAMEIVHEQRDLERYMREAVKVSEKSPVLLDRFLDDAIEVDVDCISDGAEVMIGGNLVMGLSLVVVSVAVEIPVLLAVAIVAGVAQSTWNFHRLRLLAPKPMT